MTAFAIRGATFAYTADPFAVDPATAYRYDSDGAVVIEDGVIREVGSAGLVLPRHPGILCALGLLLSDLKTNYAQTRLIPATAESLPRIIAMRSSGPFRGDDWIGLKMREASVVRGIGVLPVFAGLLGLLLLIGALAATWAREGR